MKREPLIRHPKNPILTPEQMPFRCYTVMNSGATLFNDEVLLMLRVEDCERRTRFVIATSKNGIDFKIWDKPIQYPMNQTEKFVGGRLHRFDARITYLEGKYYICHASWLDNYGCVAAMASTTDFIHFEPVPYTSEPSNRNAVLFPEKIGGLFARLDRPQGTDGSGHIWVSYSPDLIFWGKSLPVKELPATDWNRAHNGAGAIPIKTEKGWLEIYHATAPTCSSTNYYLGAVLLDLQDPSKVIAAPREYILAAEKDYECMGQTPNVVFTSGAVELPDGTLNIYYGGADTRMCLAQTTVNDLVEFCLNSK